MSTEISIVVPTYREADNLAELMARIHAALSSSEACFEVIIVDDDSGDGTIEICAELAQRYPIRLETRKNQRGLATAVLHGLRRATGEILVVMDADLSHPPESLPNLVHAIRDGAEMAIGSRYVPGGDTDDQWGFFRWLNSRVATLLARPLTRIKDPMAGFFAVRRSTLSNATSLDPIGYKIGLEILVKCRCCAVKELPIRFADRARGDSKMDLSEQWKYLAHLKRLYAYKMFTSLTSSVSNLSTDAGAVPISGDQVGA